MASLTLFLHALFLPTLQCKSGLTSLGHKYSNNNDVLFDEVDLKKRNSHVIQNLEILYPDGHVISDKKKKDLMELLNFIPPVNHCFYNELKTSNTAVDIIFNDEPIDD